MRITAALDVSDCCIADRSMGMTVNLRDLVSV
jgi:hypothetical protein